MNEDYWNRVALSYDNEIFDVYRSDRRGTLQKYLRKHSRQGGLAIDFGCGPGKALGYLAPGFDEVIAIDISQNCINTAKEIVKESELDNVTLKRMDLARQNLKLPACDFAVCVNVAILPDLEKNMAIITNISRTLKDGASAIVVVPSLESALFTSWQMVNWYKKEGTEPEEIPASEFSNLSKDRAELVQGLVKIDNEPTKHYLHAELHTLFDEAGLQITQTEKLEYDWATEFTQPPAWMQPPGPWDWMVECRKN